MICPACAADTGSSGICPSCGALVEAKGLAGTVVAGRYEVRERLGAGGMGVVYKAHDRLLDEIVALKVLRRDITGSDEMARRFLGEIRLARAVSHRNVCRIHDYGEEGGLRYVSMAYVEGVDLGRLLSQRGRFAGGEAAALCAQVAEALSAIHQEGIVHRDLKPGNVMIDPRGVARVMDFGIAKHSDNAASLGMTGTGQIIGTPTYMSPEQIRGEKLDGRADLYSLGVVVYELVTGRAPFKGDTPLATLFKHVNEAPPLTGPESMIVPAPLLPILVRALAKDRKDRFPTAREMADALAQAGRESGEVVPPRTETIAPAALAPFARTVSPAPTAPPPPVTELQSDIRLPRVLPAAAPRGRRGWLVGLATVLALAVVVVTARLWRAEPTVVSPSPVPAASLPSVPETSLAAAATLAPLIVPGPATSTTPPSSVAAVREPPAARSAAHVAPSMPPRAEGISGAAQMAGLLAEADAALADHANEMAGSLYDQVLAIDPGNERARAGRARVVDALARPAAPAVHGRFVASQTRVDAPAGTTGPAGFDGAAGLGVRKIEQAQAPASKIYFEVSPSTVSPGDRYVVKVSLVNEGAAPVDVAAMTAATTVNGRRSGGALEPRVRHLAPGERGPLLETGDVWRAETATWTMTITVRTSRGESYTNQLTWE